MLAQVEVEELAQQVEQPQVRGAELLESFDFQEAGFIILVFNVLFFSASWSASIAEDRVRDPKISFLLGLLIPVIYPLFILVTMGMKKAAPKKNIVEEEVKKESEIYAEDATTIFDESALDYNEHFFRKYYLAHTEGKKYIFEVDGLPVTVDKILEVRAELLVVQAVDKAENSQTLRIPYNSIENFSEL